MFVFALNMKYEEQSWKNLKEKLEGGRGWSPAQSERSSTPTGVTLAPPPSLLLEPTSRLWAGRACRLLAERERPGEQARGKLRSVTHVRAEPGRRAADPRSPGCSRREIESKRTSFLETRRDKGGVGNSSSGGGGGGGWDPEDRKTGNTWTKQGIEFQPQETFVSVSTVALALLRLRDRSRLGAAVCAGIGHQHV